MEFLFFAALALALGFKHSFDVDHIVAVSNLLTRQPRLERALSMAATWAGGHMLTAGLISTLVYLFAEAVLPVTSRFELMVPFLLLAIGLFGILVETKRIHYHRHRHESATGSERGEHGHFHVHFKSAKHEHGAMAGIGFMHGLASNDELLIVLLVGLGAESIFQVLGGVAFFSMGVVVGMCVYAASIHATSQPMSRRFGWNWLPSALTIVFSAASIAYGVYLLAGGQGINLIGKWYGA